MISILLATKNRPAEIIACIHSILTGSYSKFEIIIIDQSKTTNTRDRIYSLASKKIRYVSTNYGNKSTSLNQGIEMAKGNILAFTDDDCIVDKHWLASIKTYFDNDHTVDAIFGRTLPYNPTKNTGKICPSIFPYTVKKIITKPMHHAQHIGFGNNMAIRKSIALSLGSFKTWLGPGSAGGNCEDGEYALRLLNNNHKICFNPRVIVYHNKWLTLKEMAKLELSYICGEMACYGYFYFLGYQFAIPIIRINLQILDKNIKDKIFKKNNTVSLLFELQRLIAIIRGLLVGRYYAITEKITRIFSSQELA